MSRVAASLHTANAPGAHLYRAMWPGRLVRRWLYQRSAPLVRQPLLLNADELAGLMAWPLGDVSLAGTQPGRHQGAGALIGDSPLRPGDHASQLPRHGTAPGALAA